MTSTAGELFAKAIDRHNAGQWQDAERLYREVTKLERDIHIDASPEDVYAKLMDPDCLGEWVTIQEELLEAPGGDLEQGDELVQKCRVAGRKFKLSWTVEKADKLKLITSIAEGVDKSDTATKARPMRERAMLLTATTVSTHIAKQSGK